MMVQDRTAALALQPGAGLTNRYPVSGQLTSRVRGEQSGGVVTLPKSEIAPHDGPPLHLHEYQDECRYVLEGELRIRHQGDVHPCGSRAIRLNASRR